ncbi:MAG: hypothetical protein JWO36_3984 [Myxococcales bacterium]|nr:hypothetical protein [Myxococcales bacterium]
MASPRDASDAVGAGDVAETSKRSAQPIRMHHGHRSSVRPINATIASSVRPIDAMIDSSHARAAMVGSPKARPAPI